MSTTQHFNKTVICAVVLFAVVILVRSLKKSNSRFTRNRAIKHNQNASKSTPSLIRKDGISVFIDLKLPFGKDYLLHTVSNEMILEKAINSELINEDKLFINLSCNDEEEAVVASYQYISKLYPIVWNCFIKNELLNIGCYIISDISSTSSSIISKEDVYLRPDLKIIYSADESLLEFLNHQRMIKSLPTVKHIFLHKDITGRLENYFHSSTASIICFDNDPIKVGCCYKYVAVGGTFDQLHNGHRKLLTLAAISCNDTLIIGIMGDDQLRHKSKSFEISDFSVRSNKVREFLSTLKPSMRLEIVELKDPYGPTTTNESVQSIVVSSETVMGAFKINSIRMEKNMKPLDILITLRSEPVVLSSTFIRDLKHKLDASQGTL